MTNDTRDWRAVLSGQDRSLKAAVLRPALRLAGAAYSAAIRARNVAYSRGYREIHRVSVPVISIGNLTVGGTGKTPMVAWVCRQLRAHDIRVAIISRGYGADEGGVNDEAMELERLLPDVPHVQNRDRVAAARLAVDEFDMQAIVMDDGFQHRRLHRDLDIVLIDATNPFGYGRVLPSGLLREPLSGLRRADMAVVTRADQIATGELEDIRQVIQRIAPKLPIAAAAHRSASLIDAGGIATPLEALRRRPCLLVSAIGNPDAFAASVRNCGGDIQQHLVFPDHHRYTAADVAGIIRAADAALGQDLWIVCTGKDLPKLNSATLGDHPLYALEIEMHLLDNAAELERLVTSTVRENS